MNNVGANINSSRLGDFGSNNESAEVVEENFGYRMDLLALIEKEVKKSVGWAISTTVPSSQIREDFPLLHER